MIEVNGVADTGTTFSFLILRVLLIDEGTGQSGVVSRYNIRVNRALLEVPLGIMINWRRLYDWI